jgi:uncharacterized protein (TIGR02117 family)
VRCLTAGAIGWLAGCTIVPQTAAVPDGDATIYVVGRGWHTDIGLSVQDVHGPLASLERTFPGIRFMLFGFGERQFYMAHDAGSGEMLSALLPSESAILLTALRAMPTEAFADHAVVALRLPSASVQHIADRLWRDLEVSADGSAVRLADGPYPGSAFYAARETYDAFHTCNTWTALVLRDAGFPVNPQVLFAGQVMQQVSQIAAIQAR